MAKIDKLIVTNVQALRSKYGTRGLAPRQRPSASQGGAAGLRARSRLSDPPAACQLVRSARSGRARHLPAREAGALASGHGAYRQQHVAARRMA